MRGRVSSTLLRATAALRTDAGALGLATVNDLLWRSLADVRWAAVRGAEVAAEGVVVPAVVSLLSGLDAELAAVALAAQWGFVAALYYQLTPRAFRRSARELTTERPFRLATATTALGFALAVSAAVLDNPVPLQGGWDYAAAVSAACCLGLGVYGWYFQRVRGWSRLPLEDRVDLLGRFVPLPPEERETVVAAGNAPGRWSTVRVHSTSVAAVVVPLMTAFFLGVLSTLVLGLYPVVEVLALAGVAVAAAERGSGVRVPGGRALRAGLDLEGRLYGGVSVARRGVKGWLALALVVVFGLFSQVTVFGLAIRLLARETLPLVGTVLRLGPLTPTAAVIAWNAVGPGIGLLAAGTYGVWFWLRTLERLPRYLDAWAVDAGRRDPADATGRSGPGPARPVGLMLPPSLSVLAATAWGVLGSSGTAGAALTLLDAAYAIAWPAALLAMAASAWRTRSIAPQPPRSDNVAIPASLVVQFGVGLPFLWLDLSGGSGEVAIEFSPFAAFCLLAAPWLFYLQDVYRWGEAHEGTGRYALPAYLAGFGVVVGGLGLVGGGRPPTWTLAFAALTVAGGAVLAVDQFHSD